MHKGVRLSTRDMALEKGRNLFKKISEPLVSKLEGTNPATLTWLTLPTGLAAAWLMMEAGTGQEGALMFLGAAFLMASAMALDGLDGNLARATGKVTRWGDYLDLDGLDPTNCYFFYVDRHRLMSIYHFRNHQTNH